MEAVKHCTPPFPVNYYHIVCFYANMDDNESRAVANLARALGFEDGQQTAYQPYLNYIQGCWPGKRTKIEFLWLFTEVITFFIGEVSCCPF
jgi:hypothetical protein